MALTEKQRRFVAEYLVDLNATQAAIRAGYAAKRADAMGYENLRKPEIAAAVAEAMQQRAKRTEITQDRVLQELARIAFFDLRKLYREDGSMKSPDEWDDDTAAAMSGLDIQEEFGPDDTTIELEDQPQGGKLKRSTARKVLLGYTKKAKVFDKTAALTLAMRHLGMMKDKLEHSGAVQVTSIKRTIVDPKPHA